MRANMNLKWEPEYCNRNCLEVVKNIWEYFLAREKIELSRFWIRKKRSLNETRIRESILSNLVRSFVKTSDVLIQNIIINYNLFFFRMCVTFSFYAIQQYTPGNNCARCNCINLSFYLNAKLCWKFEGTEEYSRGNEKSRTGLSLVLNNWTQQWRFNIYLNMRVYVVIVKATA